jgi:hypothetical protein
VVTRHTRKVLDTSPERHDPQVARARGGGSRVFPCAISCHQMSVSGFFKDLADSFDPFKTGDMGCVAVRKVPLGGLQAECASPTRRPGPEPRPEVVAAERQSLALITLIQLAIDRREQALRDLGEEISFQCSAAAFGDGTPIGRLAIEPFTDQALAREDLESADLIDARVDMTELLSSYPISMPSGASDHQHHPTDGSCSLAHTVVGSSPTEVLLEARRSYGRISRREGDDSDTASFHDDDDDSHDGMLSAAAGSGGRAH